MPKEQPESDAVKSVTGWFGLTASERSKPKAGHNNSNLAFDAASAAENERELFDRMVPVTAL
ncbi:MAG: hypothetical protein RBS37_06745 [Bacteroidales bacterium]|nr:hypothetical protein [Bacteroidales bacterium]